MLHTELFELSDINLGYSITISEEKIILGNVFLNAFHATTSHRVFASLGQSDLPSFLVMVAPVDFVTFFTKGYSHVIVSSFIIQKIVPNHITFIPQAKHKLRNAKGSIDFHDV